jgi:GrpB-like predicted nucleotidyltransferase (UPF0157 family)
VPIVTVLAPSETWASEFGSVGARLRNELGALALRIDHIGSTAVPGLAAKDILDIQVTVAALDEALLAPSSSGLASDSPRATDPTTSRRGRAGRPLTGRNCMSSRCTDGP